MKNRFNLIFWKDFDCKDLSKGKTSEKISENWKFFWFCNIVMEIIELYKSKKCVSLFENQVKLGDGNTTDDIISELCDDILIMILDFLTLKEAVRTSVLSRRWQQLWQFFSGSFSFEASYSRGLNKEKLKTERSRFVGRINKVLNSHQVSTMLELRVSFDLGKHSKSYVDEWIGIALKKKVKKLELAFEPYFTSYHKLLYTCYRISKESFSCFTTSSGSPGTLFLRCLSLQYVGVSDENVEYILSSCPMLESLHVRMSPLLRDPKVTGSSLRLKHLNIQSCEFVQSIEVYAPNLASFEYYGKEIPLHVRYAPKLHEVCYFDPLNYSIPHAFSQLANYLPQLVSLTLNTSFDWVKIE
ncbi:F-box/LRR-repeat protein 25-like [Durio zibethinus]|uniref:F-box/LRR-repeat protein 25-like n=1 Tax=Durio zibethinus TaxID=66656 RepID=A0A6P5YQE5_DURZI|nr:F-box/LRR-repeat protein 25-like [Durio zibethinus]